MTAHALAARHRGWRRLLHHALLRGLRPQRVAHTPALEALALAGGTLTPLRVTGARGQRLATWLVLPDAAATAGPAPAVVAVHGWGANASSLWPLVEPLVHQGLAVVLFDVSSHGLSSGEDFCSLPRFADDLAAVLSALRGQHGIAHDRIALLGHSVGAAAVLLHAARHRDVRAVVSLSAFAHPREMMERWLRAHRIPRRWPGEAILVHVEQTIGARFDDIAPARLLPRIACPVMLVHGNDDTTVPLADGLRLRAALARGEWLAVDGGHDLRRALVPHTPRILGFLKHNLSGPAAP